MSRYLPEAPFEHGTPAKIGVLLINLGSPAAPTRNAVRRYLREFLSDPFVVEIPRPLWWLILNFFVLLTRPSTSAERYAQIWTPEGSPLVVSTAKQARLLRGFLGERLEVPLLVDYAMRYGEPAIPSVLSRLRAQGCDRILIVPLYPQYSASTTATACDAAFTALTSMRNQPAVRTVRHFHDHAGYINALAKNIEDYWARHRRPEQLVISFHGLPRYALDRGDPYHCECQKTGRLLAEALHLQPGQWRVTFQSRFGRAAWLQPYTSEVLKELGRAKSRRIDVVCPGFVSDCLETLEEIALEGKTIFLNAGGGEFHYIPCLNESEDWINALTDIVSANLAGWTAAESAPEVLARSRERALGLGAKA
jgi:ferrochelatase